MGLDNLLVSPSDSLRALHQFTNWRLSPLLVMDVLACVVEEIELLKEVDMRYVFPADRRTRGSQSCGGRIVHLDGVSNCLATALQCLCNMGSHVISWKI